MTLEKLRFIFDLMEQLNTATGLHVGITSLEGMRWVNIFIDEEKWLELRVYDGHAKFILHDNSGNDTEYPRMTDIPLDEIFGGESNDT